MHLVIFCCLLLELIFQCMQQSCVCVRARVCVRVRACVCVWACTHSSLTVKVGLFFSLLTFVHTCHILSILLLTILKGIDS